MTDLQLQKRFGATARKARLELGIKWEEAAREIGISSRGGYQNVEAGRSGLALPKALRLIEYLGIDVSEVFWDG